MNVKQTFKALRRIGVSVRREDGEWRIACYGWVYFTQDNNDAYGTAVVMKRWEREATESGLALREM